MNACRKLSLTALCCILALALTGCATSRELKPQKLLKLYDVPVPAGLKALPGDSYSFENVNVRTAVLKYQGRADLDQVVNFYKEQMPAYNWNLINTIEYGQRLLNFELESETCIVTIQTAGFWNEDALVTISLGPKSRDQYRKKQQLIK
jgi:hypothetical protein